LPPGVFIGDDPPDNPDHEEWTWIETSGGGTVFVQVWAYDPPEEEWVPYQAAVAGRVQVFESNGVWSRPAGGFTSAAVYVFAAGGGSGVGYRISTGASSVGGGGAGGCGGYSFGVFALADLPTTVPIIVGQGGHPA